MFNVGIDDLVVKLRRICLYIILLFLQADVQLENHHIFDATFKWTQCGTMNGHISTCKNFRFVQSLDMEYTPIHEDEFFCNL